VEELLGIFFVVLMFASLTSLFYSVMRLLLAYAFAYLAYLTLITLVALRARREAMKWLDDAEKVMRG